MEQQIVLDQSVYNDIKTLWDERFIKVENNTLSVSQVGKKISESGDTITIKDLKRYAFMMGCLYIKNNNYYIIDYVLRMKTPPEGFRRVKNIKIGDARVVLVSRSDGGKKNGDEGSVMEFCRGGVDESESGAVSMVEFCNESAGDGSVDEETEGGEGSVDLNVVYNLIKVGEDENVVDLEEKVDKHDRLFN